MGAGDDVRAFRLLGRVPALLARARLGLVLPRRRREPQGQSVSLPVSEVQLFLVRSDFVDSIP